MSPRISYDHELAKLHADLKEMGEMVENAIELSLQALESRNPGMAEDIIHDDEKVNQLERTIESKCLSLILKQQPVASDLRVVSTALKVVTDLERIGDHASDIAALVKRMSSQTGETLTIRHLPAMAQTVKLMLNQAIDSFITLDLEKAAAIIRKDDEADYLFNRVKQDVIESLKSHPEDSDQAVDLLMIAKYLERIGDHAVNVCEWTQFCQTGEVDDTRLI